MSIPRGKIVQLRPESSYPRLRHVEGPVPTGSQAAADAIERVKPRLATKTPYNKAPVVIRSDRR